MRRRRSGTLCSWLLAGAGAAFAFAGATTFAACASFSAVDSTADGASDGNADREPPRDAPSPDAAAPIGPYATAVLQDGPVAYFRLDDVGVLEGNPIFEEVTKNRVGIVHGTPTFGVAGAVDNGRAVSFPGGAWIDLGDHYGFPLTHPFSIEVFVKPSGTAFSHVFTKEQRGGPKQGYALTSGSKIEIERYVNSGSSPTPAAAISTTTFWHVVFTYDGATLALYVNGQAEATGADTRSLAAHTAPALIGAASTTGEFTFTGIIDELAIYDRALTQPQIAAHVAAR